MSWSIPEMSFLLSQRQRIDVASPVMEFYEEGPWLRIETQGQPTRYISKKIAMEILKSYGASSVTEKSDLIIL